MATLIIATWNVNGLVNHKSDVELLLAHKNIDILLISEAHLTSKSIFDIKNYCTYSTFHPDGTAHAGTAIIIKKHIKHEILLESKTDQLQATSISVHDNLGSLTLSAVYCPPKHKIKEECFTNFFKTLGQRFICGGDWNAKNVSWGSRLTLPRGREMKLSVDKNNLYTLSTGRPTYWPTDPNKKPDLLDFFVYKGFPNHYLNVEGCLDSSSDHTPIIATISTTIIERPSKEKLHSKNTDWDAFRQYLDTNLNLKVALRSEGDIDEAATHITKLIQTAAWKSTPANIKRQGTKNLPRDIRTKILEKRRLRRVWHNSRHSSDKKAFNKAAAELKHYLKEIKDDELKNKLENLNPQARNEHSLWKTVKNSKDAPQAAHHPIKLNDNSWAKNDKDRAEAFGSFLSQVFTPNDGDAATESEMKLFLETDMQLSPPLRCCSPREIQRAIKDLEPNKAPGFCLITAEVLKQLSRKAIVFLTQLFNAIMRIGYYPSIWKISEIIMIPKHGKPPHLVSSYRPISLLPVMSKLFEKIVLRRLNEILKINNTIPLHQFGFRRGHSTVEQVHRVADKIRDALEKKQYCSAVFLDVQQAFDKVWHQGLLFKIKSLLPHNMYVLLQSYIQKRIFRVRVNDSYSGFHEIKAGVPQGSVLGPTLYLVYTADIPTTDNVLSATFADDTAALYNDKNPEAASLVLQTHLDKVDKWMDKWRIKASANKSTHVTFTLRRENCPPVKLGNAILPHQETAKYLGIHLDRKQTWRTHIEKKRDELNIQLRKLNWLLGRSSNVSLENKVLIYKAVLKPVWAYGIELWGSAKNSNLEILQRFQNKVLRNISNAPWFIKNTELHEHLKINTIKEEIEHRTNGYKQRICSHTNSLATALHEPLENRRLKRQHIWDFAK